VIGERPNDSRGFLHKRLIGVLKRVAFGAGGPKGVAAIGSNLPGPLGELSRIGGSLLGGGGGAAPRICPPGTPGCGPRQITPTACPPGTIWDPQGGFCVSPRSPFGGRQLADQFGDAEAGRFGAGLVPASVSGITRRCPRGAVLGLDGLCYNKRDLRNGDRMWPRGTRPLLTGGDMRCIRIAARASNKLRTKTKQLQRMGMLPKPTRRAVRALPGHHTHTSHD